MSGTRLENQIEPSSASFFVSSFLIDTSFFPPSSLQWFTPFLPFLHPPLLSLFYFRKLFSPKTQTRSLSMDKSLHVTGILIYRHQRNSTEVLLVNDSFNHKRHWTAPKGRVIGDEDELKYVDSHAVVIVIISSLSLMRLRQGDLISSWLSGERKKKRRKGVLLCLT